MTLDIKVYQLQHIAGKEHTVIPGVLAEKAAKSTHRHRQSDILAMQLVLDGTHTYTGADLQEFVHKASGSFFHAQGSVTRAIQSIIDDLNRDIYSYNSDWGYDGKQAFGSINICVLRNGALYIGQVGDAHVYRIREGVFEIFGASGESLERLGTSRRITPRFYQSAVDTDDLLIISPHAHGSWKSYYLSDSHKLPIEQLKRRLHNQMIQDFSVVVLKTANGTGKVYRGDWSENLSQDPRDDEQQVIQKKQPAAPAEKAANSETVDQRESPEVSSEVNLEPILIDEVDEVETSAEHVESAFSISEGETESDLGFDLDEYTYKNQDRRNQRKITVSLAKLWMQGKTLRSKAQLFTNRIDRLVAFNKNSPIENPFNWRIGAIILIPVILTSLSLFIYTRSGKDEQFTSLMETAVEKAHAAEEITNDAESKALWEEVLELSSNAENYRVTTESRQLFTRAQSIIDGMDLSTRLEFRPAMTQPFPEEALVTKIKEGTSGVYLLDSATGNVLRSFTNSKGFLELDDEFKCVPGQYGLVEMGEIVDYAILPANSMGYKVLAIDAVGNLLYCQPGKSPDARTLTTPEGGWGKIESLVYDENRLIVIDPPKNNIWIYQSHQDNQDDLSGIVFVETPVSFFDEEIPDIGGAIQTVINQEDLYILHEDGHMSLCQYGYEEVRLTVCEDPIPFTDDRISSENKKPWIFMGTHFIGMDHASLPSRSIYILDDVSGTVFRFSMQLNLESTLKPQIRKDFPLPDVPPSGFGILQDQELIIAFRNQLFTAPLK